MVPPTNASPRRALLMRRPRSTRERGGVWGTGRFPALSEEGGPVGETWFPPRTRARGERCSCGDPGRRVSGEGCGEPGGSPRFQKKGVPWGKHGSPHEREPEASAAHAATPVDA